MTLTATPTANLVLDETRLAASICRDSFFDFVKEFWDVLIPEDPVWNWHIEFLCDEFQQLIEGVFEGRPKPHDLIVNISPGTTKSTLASIMLPAWSWTRMPSMRWICGSHAFDLGMDLSRKCRDLIISDKYQRYFPEVRLRDDQAAKSYFVNTAGGMRYVATVGGRSPMGFHAHAIVVDDPLDPQAARAMSEKDLGAANHWMTETLPSRKVHKAITPTLLIMQRLHQNDPSGNRLESAKPGEIRHISLPAEATGDIRPPELAEHYQDGLFDPVRLPRSVLLEQQGLSEYAYAGQYLQSPVPLGGGMFKVDRIEVIDAPPAAMTTMVRYWDKAGTPGGGDFTVGVKMGVHIEPGNRLPCYYIVDVVRGQWDSAAREALIRQTAELDGKAVKIGLEQEPGSAGKESAENTARRLAGFRVKIDRVTGPKEVRADTFSSQVNAHNVKVVRAPWTKALLDELRFFPMGTNDDQVDACSGSFSMLTKPRMQVGAF